MDCRGSCGCPVALPRPAHSDNPQGGYQGFSMHCWSRTSETEPHVDSHGHRASPRPPPPVDLDTQNDLICAPRPVIAGQSPAEHIGGLRAYPGAGTNALRDQFATPGQPAVMLAW